MAKGFKIADGYMEVTADHSKADRQLDGFFRSTDGRLRNARGRFAKEGQIAGEEYGRQLTEAAEHKQRQSFAGLAMRFGRRFLALGGMAGKLFANGFVLKAVAGLAALPTALSVTGALAQGIAQIGGALAALAPAAIGGAIFTLATLKIAMSGFGDALKAGLSGDTAKFAEALQKLAPAAQQAAKAFVSLAPAARELKRTVQNSFFAPWMKDIVPLANTYLPLLRVHMAGLAGDAGMAVHELAHMLQFPAVVQQMNSMFANFRTTFGNVVAGLPSLVSGFLTLAAAGSSWLSRMTSGFAGLAVSFGNWADAFVASGRFDAFVARGLDNLRALKDVLVDVAGIFNKIFAAVPGGGGLLAMIGQLADGLNRFLETMQGQEMLTGFFARLQTLAALIMDLVKGALPGLLAISDGLLKGFEALQPVASVVGSALGDALSALAPLIPVIANLLAPLLALAATVLKALAAELGPVIKLFSDMANQVLPMLVPMIDEFASQVLPIAIDAGLQLADAFAPLVPLWVEMARTIGGELMRQLPALVEVASQMVPVFIEVARILTDTWITAFKEIRPHLPFLVAMFAALLKITGILLTEYASKLPYVITFFSWFIKAAAWVAGVVLSLRNLPGAIANAAAAFWGWLKGVGAAIAEWFASVGRWFSELPGKIWAGLQQIPTLISNAWSSAFDQFWYWVGYITATVGKFILDIPDKLRAMWAAVTSAVSNGVNSAIEWFQALPLRAELAFIHLYNSVTTWVANTFNSVSNWLSQLPGRVGAWFTETWNRAKTTTISGFNSVINTVKGIPGAVMNAVSGAGHWLYDAGRDILHGLINGFNSALDWARNAVRRAMEKIKEGAKDALGISSPSKVFAMEVGRWIPPGIAQGIERSMPDLERVLNMRMGALASATKAPQVNVAAPQVSVGGATVTLLVDGEEIAARIVTPDRVARTGAEGNRRRGFLNTGRVATV